MQVFWFDPATDYLKICGEDEPLLRVTDQTVSRGNGVFETVAVFRGRILSLTAHLERMQRSASQLNLTPIDISRWEAVLLQAAQTLAEHEQGALRVVYGPVGDGKYRAWVVAFAVDDFAARSEGISIVTLERGIKAGVGQQHPWLLYGSKNLSYAINMAALEEAKRRGADDALFISEDGWLLEGTTSNLLVYDGQKFLSPDPARNSILAGTTQAKLYKLLDAEGQVTELGMLPVSELMNFRSVWLTSSVRMVTPVKAINGKPTAVDYELTRRLNDKLIAAAGLD